MFKLLFNSKTNISYYPSGVDIRIPGFGETHSVEYIDDSWEAFLLDNIGAYGHELVQGTRSNYSWCIYAFALFYECGDA